MQASRFPLKHYSIGTNGLLHSAVHRVKAPPTAISGGWTPERYSIPFVSSHCPISSGSYLFFKFCSPVCLVIKDVLMGLLYQDYDTIVDCLPGTWSDENPKKYEPVTVRFFFHLVAL